MQKKAISNDQESMIFALSRSTNYNFKMKNLKALNMSALVDMLAAQTIEYHLQARVNPDRAAACYMAIMAIQDEIDARKGRNRFIVPDNLPGLSA